MKSFIFACCLLSALLCLNLYLYFEVRDSCLKIDSLLDEVIMYVSEEDFDQGKEKYALAKEIIKENKKIWHIVTNHQEVDNIEATMKELNGYFETNSKEHILAKTNLLKFYVVNIYAREKVTFENIL